MFSIHHNLQNYDASATTEHAKGFYIGDKLAKVFMDVAVANSQIKQAIQGIPLGSLNLAPKRNLESHLTLIIQINSQF